MDSATWNTILMIVAGVVTAGIFAYRTFSKQSLETKFSRLALIGDLAQAAANALDVIASKTATSIDDKIKEALDKVAETFRAQTGKPMTPGEEAVAKMKVQAAVASKLSP